MPFAKGSAKTDGTDSPRVFHELRLKDLELAEAALKRALLVPNIPMETRKRVIAAMERFRETRAVVLYLEEKMRQQDIIESDAERAVNRGARW